MFPEWNRRSFLQTIVAGAAHLSLASSGFAQSRPAAQSEPGPKDPAHNAPLVATSLADHVTLISGGGGNVVMVAGPDAAVMVNGGLKGRSRELLELVSTRAARKRIQTLFNTDWHPEHTGSNETLGKGGTAILAHENTKQYLGAEMLVEWQHRTYTPLPAAALPARTFYTSGRMTLGSETIEYGHLGQAHTDGDIYVLARDANVLVAGDVIAVGAYPIADYTTGGWLGGMVTATKTLLDLSNANTRIVPGTGPVQTRADVQAQYDMLVAMRDRLSKMMKQGMGVDDMIAAGVSKDFDARWGNAQLFVTTSCRGMWLHVRELGGVV
jgi:cyclase